MKANNFTNNSLVVHLRPSYSRTGIRFFNIMSVLSLEDDPWSQVGSGQGPAAAVSQEGLGGLVPQNFERRHKFS